MLTRHLILVPFLAIAILSLDLNPLFGTPAQVRGVVALPNEYGDITVAWRLLKTDPPDIAFQVYRRDLYSEQEYRPLNKSPLKGTTYRDDTAINGNSYRYRVHAIVQENEAPSRDSAYVTSTDWHRPYVSIALEGDYETRTVALGNLNGDGVLDYLVKQPNFNTDPYHRKRYWKRSRKTYKLEAYCGLKGRLLWRYDMGWAIESGTWYSPYIVYDLDQDGTAEVFTKGGEGDPREIDGRVISGPEYLVQLDGRTGQVIRRIPWLMEDRQYRLGVTAGSMGYYREPQLSLGARCPEWGTKREP